MHKWHDMALFSTLNGILGLDIGPRLIGTNTFTSLTAQTLPIIGTPSYILAKLWGGGGGGALVGKTGGKGGFVSALIPYTGQTILYSVAVGGDAAGGATNNGGVTGGGNGKGNGAGGGGLSGLFLNSVSFANALLIAAGGGGASSLGGGGDGGGTTGASSETGSSQGGSQVAGGSGSVSGGQLFGGSASTNNNSGGGSGYYGGGSSVDGGGGSCYALSSYTNINIVRGNNTSDTNWNSGANVGGGGAVGGSGFRGEIYIEYWTGDPYAAGLR